MKISIITVAFLVELLYVGNNLHSSLQDIKVENPLILEKIEFGEDYEVAILMNTRNKLIEWLESEDDTRTYSELDLDSYVLELADNASLTECVHEDKEYNPTLLREQINSISSLIKQKI